MPDLSLSAARELDLRSILIIEDDDDDILLICERMQEIIDTPCAISICDNKQQAVELLKSNDFDLCLLDHRLGDFDGIEILSALKNVTISTPIIMLTGQSDNTVENFAIRNGAQDYIMKSQIKNEAFSRSLSYAVSRKQLEMARISNERFKLENMAKDKFIAHLSHELRTPLTSILGYTSLLLESHMAAPLQKELTIINNNSNHLLNLLNDVLDLSKISSGKFELNNRLCQFHLLIAEVYSLLSVSALDKGLRFECRCLTPIAECIEADELRIKQVLINLTGNAIKFTDKGTVLIELSQPNSSSITVKIIDTGIGLDSQQIETIFQPFSQVEDVADRKAGGAGLGLSISAEIIKQMGGTLDVQSNIGEGSEFVFTLPVEIPHNTASRYFDYDVYCQTPITKSKPQFDGRVLIVDDVFEIRQLIGHYVKQHGCDVVVARNGKTALDILEKTLSSDVKFDLVLMDLHMPAMTGAEATIKLKQTLPELPVVAITAAIQKGTKAELLDLGFDNLLAKPIEPNKLADILARYLQQGEAIKGQNTADITHHSNRLSVCLVEDDADSAGIMEMLLARLGFTIMHFCNGNDCINALNKNNFDVFLIDLGLPDIRGEVLLEAIAGHSHEQDIFIVSGNELEQEFVKKYHIKGQLLKPVSFKQLKSALTP